MVIMIVISSCSAFLWLEGMYSPCVTMVSPTKIYLIHTTAGIIVL